MQTTQDESKLHAAWGIALGVYLTSAELLRASRRSSDLAGAVIRHASDFAALELSVRECGIEPAIGALDPHAAHLRQAAIDWHQGTLGAGHDVIEAESNIFWQRILLPTTEADHHG